MAERALTIGIQSFEDIRSGNYVYVDKTRYVWDLVSSGKTCFLSRPRRFGKSLLTTTLQCYFEGRKDLFEGLWIWEKENARKEPWIEYPVISFYLSGGLFQNPDGLENILQSFLSSAARKYGVELEGKDLAVRFRNLIEKLYEKTGRKVVILIDEYDKPLLTAMFSDPAQEEKNRQLYSGFFGILKDEDPYLRFVFFTGVTKFTKVSIFSDLNQLDDISLRDDYSAICGITGDELTAVYGGDGKKAEDLKTSVPVKACKNV